MLGSRSSVSPISIPADVPEQPLQNPVIDPLIFGMAFVVLEPGLFRGVTPDLTDSAVDNGWIKVSPFVWALYAHVRGVFRFKNTTRICFKVGYPVIDNFFLRNICQFELYYDSISILDDDIVLTHIALNLHLSAAVCSLSWIARRNSSFEALCLTGVIAMTREFLQRRAKYQLSLGLYQLQLVFLP